MCYSLPPGPAASRYLVVAPQGKGDEPALRTALSVDATYLAFVRSRKKMAAPRAKLADAVTANGRGAVYALVGLDLGAITSTEIALSIRAPMMHHRRQGQRLIPARLAL